jgi:hypothetical protein
MLFPKPFWEGLANGSVSVAFRYWKRPTVRAGGTLQTPAGLLAIDTCAVVALGSITLEDAQAAGYGSRAELVRELTTRRGPGRTLYRVSFHYAGEDPRRALRDQAELDRHELAQVQQRLARMDRASRAGPWTMAVLELIRENPGTVAAELAARRGQERLKFKADVRKLKALGLTESLRVGYRLSPRGAAVLELLDR